MNPAPSPAAPPHADLGTNAGAQPRVVFAEDNVLLREGLRMVLERNGFLVAATVGTAGELVDATRHQTPDLVITDVRMPPTYSAEGLQAAARIRAENPDQPVVVLSQYVEQSYLTDLLDSGSGTAIGYLLKDRVADVADFVDTLHRVLTGGTAVDPAVISQLIARRRNPLQRLTPVRPRSSRSWPKVTPTPRSPAGSSSPKQPSSSTSGTS